MSESLPREVREYIGRSQISVWKDLIETYKNNRKVLGHSIENATESIKLLKVRQAWDMRFGIIALLFQSFIFINSARFVFETIPKGFPALWFPIIMSTLLLGIMLLQAQTLYFICHKKLGPTRKELIAAYEKLLKETTELRTKIQMAEIETETMISAKEAWLEQIRRNTFD